MSLGSLVLGELRAAGGWISSLELRHRCKCSREQFHNTLRRLIAEGRAVRGDAKRVLIVSKDGREQWQMVSDVRAAAGVMSAEGLDGVPWLRAVIKGEPPGEPGRVHVMADEEGE